MGLAHELRGGAASLEHNSVRTEPRRGSALCGIVMPNRGRAAEASIISTRALSSSSGSTNRRSRCTPSTGLHHVTAIAGPAQENLDFYAGVLGMRLVKSSVNQDDPGTYHLFYADAEGRPGTDLTFFPWSHLAPSREGHGLSSEVGLAIPPGSLSFWTQRLAHYGVTAAPVERRFGAHVLPVTDPHGLRVALVESEHASRAPFTPWEHSPVPAERQIRGLETARLRERDLEPTDVVPDAGARLRAARHRERLAALRRVGRALGRLRRRAGGAGQPPRRLGRRQHPSPGVAGGRRGAPAGGPRRDRARPGGGRRR